MCPRAAVQRTGCLWNHISPTEAPILLHGSLEQVCQKAPVQLQVAFITITHKKKNAIPWRWQVCYPPVQGSNNTYGSLWGSGLDQVLLQLYFGICEFQKSRLELPKLMENHSIWTEQTASILTCPRMTVPKVDRKSYTESKAQSHHYSDNHRSSHSDVGHLKTKKNAMSTMKNSSKLYLHPFLLLCIDHTCL